MKLWVSAETSGGSGKSPIPMLRIIKDAFNDKLSQKDYGADINELSYMAIITTEKYDIFDEVLTFDKKEREFEFRLKIPVSDYKVATDQVKLQLLFSSILRAINETEKLAVKGFNTTMLREDFINLGKEQGWT